MAFRDLRKSKRVASQCPEVSGHADWPRMQLQPFYLQRPAELRPSGLSKWPATTPKQPPTCDAPPSWYIPIWWSQRRRS
jgi:hypothetical protein